MFSLSWRMPPPNYPKTAQKHVAEWSRPVSNVPHFSEQEPLVASPLAIAYYLVIIALIGGSFDASPGGRNPTDSPARQRPG